MESFPPLAILYVEDDRDAREILSSVLAVRYPALGLLTAADGAAGLELFKERRPEIVLTDIQLPVLDGIALSAEIRSLAPDAFIVALTASSDASYLMRGIEIGINQYLLKPTRHDKLFPILDAAIAKIGADRRLAAQNEQIRTLSIAIEQCPNCVVITDPRGSIEYANPAFGRLTGFAPADVLGKNPRLLQSGATPPALYRELWSTIKSGEVWRGEFQNRRANGELYWESASISPVFDESGDIAHFVAVKEDVTESRRLTAELRRAHDELEERVGERTRELLSTVQTLIEEIGERIKIEGGLRESEARYHSLFEHMLDGVAYCALIFDDRGAPADFVYLDVNSSFGRLTGLAEVVGKKVSEVVPGIRESNPELLEIFGRVAASGKPERFESEIHPLGIWLSIGAYSPEPGKFVAVFDNITERKLAVLALEQKSEELEQAQRLAGAGSWQLEVSSGKVTWSNELYRIHGFSPDAPLPSYEEHGRIFTAESLRMIEQAVATTLATGEPHQHVLELLRPDGGRRWITSRGEAVRDRDGTISKLRGISMDITERRQLEQQLIAAKKLEAIGQLAGGLAHEVRNPLNAILSVSEALFKEKGVADNPEYQPYIKHIRTQVNRLAYLMNDLLELGKPIPVASLLPVPLREVCAEAIKLLELSGVAKEHRIVAAWGEESSPPRVLADGGKLQQVVANLLENAIQHTPKRGEVLLRLSFPDSGDAESSAAITIVDCGCGIPADRIGRVFEPFYSTRRGGTGLGLALVKHFVDHMGGEVSIGNNTPGPGCTAQVRIPIAREEQ